MYADFEYRTESGEVFLKIKKKDEELNCLVFEKDMDLLSERERASFRKDWESFTAKIALLGVRLFDSQEIFEAIQARMMTLVEADETGETTLARDIDIHLFDHGTCEIVTLTIGISVPKGALRALENQ